MKFCSVCDNMYYMRVDEEKEDQLVYYCRNCGNVDKETTDNMCVLHTNFKRKEQKFHNFIPSNYKRANSHLLSMRVSRFVV